jgi:hypothetical protein
VCDCGDVEHQFIVSYFDDDVDDDFTYVHVHLTHMPVWDRIKTAIAYVLGKRSRFGVFGEILLTADQCARLANLLEQRSRGVKPNVQ